MFDHFSALCMKGLISILWLLSICIPVSVVLFFFCLYLVCNLAVILLFQVNNGNTRKMLEICSKLIIKTPECHWHCSIVFIANFEQISLFIQGFHCWATKCRLEDHLARKYLFKVLDKDRRLVYWLLYWIYSKSTIKALEVHWSRFGVYC